MHLRPISWHLIDYAITQQSSISDALLTTVRRGAECFIDHRLVLYKLKVWSHLRKEKLFLS